ncbi:hypothetical protein QJS10_CPB22g01021 [Acorus calamus]|uniref:Uncharacterized protein n=1 Tax=Acorus calamus TaxID=4465 RepID=A0AAV9BZZ2_ACOCL|nr:hypothetical protein QJS10_CPB22g01021 [Acorus calamus]
MAAEVSFRCKRSSIGRWSPTSSVSSSTSTSPLPVALGELTRKLRESLSTVLTAYPAVTGRLQRDSEGHWMIKCNDAGVRMVEATVKGSVEEWLSHVDREEELRLVHWEDMFQNPCFWSTFYVQLTEFEGGGLAIGLSCAHLLADAACATMLAQCAITPFEVLAGLFWVCVGRAQGKPTGPKEMLVCVDARDPLGLHRGFFGNAMVFSPAHCPGPMTVEAASKAVHEAAGRVRREAVLDLVEWLTSNGRDPGLGPPDFYGPGLVCADWAGLGSYGAVFEAGVRPARVSCYVGPIIGEGQILILPSSEGSDGSMGRVVMVTLPENQASKLCEEPLLLSYSPTLIMGVKGNS